MKKVFLAGLLGVFTLTMVSCGGGHGSCDAYRKADYSKYKKEQTKKIEIKNIFENKKKK